MLAHFSLKIGHLDSGGNNFPKINCPNFSRLVWRYFRLVWQPPYRYRRHCPSLADRFFIPVKSPWFYTEMTMDSTDSVSMDFRITDAIPARREPKYTG